MNADLACFRARNTRGIVSVAVLIFFVAILTVSLAMFMTMSAVGVSLRTFDIVRLQTIEKNGVAQIVQQSIISNRGTLINRSLLTIEADVSNRLAALNISPNVHLSLTRSEPVPSHAFYPFDTSAAISPKESLAGIGQRIFPLLESGIYSYLGAASFEIKRDADSDSNESRNYKITAELFSVPLTSIPIVAYGLPNTTGLPPSAAPDLPKVAPNSVGRLVMTSNNPANDPTALADLFANTSPEQWPSQFSIAATWCWDAYEYLWSPAYLNGLLFAASTSTCDFLSENHLAIPGISTLSGTILVNIGAITSSTVVIVDSIGGNTINVVGSSSEGPAFILFIKNNSAQRTTVTFSTENHRPFLLLAENCFLQFTGNPGIKGAFFLDSKCSAQGEATLFGHLSYYASSPLFPGWNLTVNGSAGYEVAYAAIAPRVLLVSTQSIR